MAFRCGPSYRGGCRLVLSAQAERIALHYGEEELMMVAKYKGGVKTGLNTMLQIRGTLL